MVTIWPSFIMALMTSAAFTDILCARSATVMVSGTCTSITFGSDGAANVASAVLVAMPRRRRRASASRRRAAGGVAARS